MENQSDILRRAKLLFAHRYVKTLARAAGLVLVLLSIGYVVFETVEQWNNLKQWRPTGLFLLCVAAGALLYALCGFLLAAAWRNLLPNLDKEPGQDRKLVHIYARSQITKYIPGNVAQVAYRHVMAHKLVGDHALLAKSAALEIASLSLAGLLVGAIAWFPGVLWQVLLFTIAALAALFIAWRAVAYVPSVSAFAGAVLLHSVFFVVVGFILIGLLYAVQFPDLPQVWLQVVGVLAFSWIAGMLTPGSPSGVGIREALIVSLLGSAYEAELLVAVLAFRVVTILGDVCFFGLRGRKQA